MELMTKELEDKFAKQICTDDKSEKEVLVLAHYFSNSWNWWATEYDPESRRFFGLVRGFEIELGYFSLDELEENSCNVRPLGGIERDLYWTPITLAGVRAKLEREEALHGS